MCDVNVFTYGGPGRAGIGTRVISFRLPSGLSREMRGSHGTLSSTRQVQRHAYFAADDSYPLRICLQSAEI